MLKELKIRLQNQYDQMYPKTDWKEVTGCILVGVLFMVFTALWFGIL